MTFTIQYETTIDGNRAPVVRYDTAHGYVHRDLLDRRGQVVDKQRVAEGLAHKRALEIGERDIRVNWPRYRQDFLRGRR